jgi:hypothetical protein
LKQKQLLLLLALLSLLHCQTHRRYHLQQKLPPPQ